MTAEGICKPLGKGGHLLCDQAERVRFGCLGWPRGPGSLWYQFPEFLPGDVCSLPGSPVSTPEHWDGGGQAAVSSEMPGRGTGGLETLYICLLELMASRKGGCEARGPERRAGKATLPPPRPTAPAVMPVGSVVKLRRQVLFL